MTNEQVKNTYIKYLTKLNRATNNGVKAPHKPILLLSILQLIRKGEITSNRIFITPELVLAFKSNWNTLVTTNNICTFALPFFHLKSEPFWHLTYLRSGAGALKSISTLKSLNDTIAFAEIDQPLFLLMADAVTNTMLENILLEFYFPSSTASYLKEASDLQYTLELEIKNQIVNDTKEEYLTKMQSLEEVLTDEEIQEERFIRGGIFKKEIPRIYNHQCCISGMKIQTTSNAQMVDACHIIPFSISNDDTISNGICLSPNLHRAFDRGLFTINEEYIVRISPSVNESNSPYGITQFAGKRIDLPKEIKLYPSTQNLSWHRKECFVL
ncbi:HNH endonuclease [Flavobacterium chungnamense]|uniref:HNH endonuclease n=1 Tax=Flavobacterium chungnamense TaxID=706182 RepID=A0ABP7V4N1_9FLAO